MEQVNKLIKVATMLGNIAGKVFEDGKITASDIVVLPDFMSIAGLLSDTDYKAIQGEFTGFNGVKCNLMINTVVENLNIPQKNIEKTIKASLVAGGTIVGAVFTIISIFNAPTLKLVK